MQMPNFSLHCQNSFLIALHHFPNLQHILCFHTTSYIRRPYYKKTSAWKEYILINFHQLDLLQTKDVKSDYYLLLSIRV